MPIVRQLNEEYKTFLNEIDTNDPKALVDQVERIIKEDISDEEKRAAIEALEPIKTVLNIDLTDLANFDKNIAQVKKNIAITDGLSEAAQNALNDKLNAFIGAFDITLPAEGSTKKNIQVISKAAALLPGGISYEAQIQLDKIITRAVETIPVVTKTKGKWIGLKQYNNLEEFNNAKKIIQELSQHLFLAEATVAALREKWSKAEASGRVSNQKFIEPLQALSAEITKKSDKNFAKRLRLEQIIDTTQFVAQHFQGVCPDGNQKAKLKAELETLLLTTELKIPDAGLDVTRTAMYYKEINTKIDLIYIAKKFLNNELSEESQTALNAMPASLTTFVENVEMTVPDAGLDEKQITEHYQKINRNLTVISKASAITEGLSVAAQAALNDKLNAFITAVDISNMEHLSRNIWTITHAAKLLTDGLNEDSQDKLNTMLAAFVANVEMTVPNTGLDEKQIAEYYQQIERKIDIFNAAVNLLPGRLNEAAQAALNKKIRDTVAATPVVTKTKKLGVTTLPNEKEFNEASQLITNLSEHVILAQDTEEAFKTKLETPGNISPKFFYEPFKSLVSRIQHKSVQNLTLQIQRSEVNSLASAQDLLYVGIKNKFSHWEISRKDLVAKLMGDKGIGPQDQKNFKEILTEEYIGKALAIAGDNPDLKYFQARVCLIAGDAKAFGLLGKLNEKRPNNPKILTDLGQCHEHGIGVEKNEGKAFGYYQQAAEQTHAPALFALGHCYEDGIGVEKDEGEAFQNYQQAATQNFALAQHELGRCNQYGIGVEIDKEEAFGHYQQAAEQGLAEAQYELGACYLKGFGCQKDKSKAFVHFQQAVKQGLAEAQCELGYCYENGIGCKKNRYLASAYYQAAADQGLAEAQFSYGEINEHMAKIFKTPGFTAGSLIKQTQEEALKYYQLAAEQGLREAQEALTRVEAKLGQKAPTSELPSSPRPQYQPTDAEELKGQDRGLELYKINVEDAKLQRKSAIRIDKNKWAEAVTDEKIVTKIIQNIGKAKAAIIKPEDTTHKELNDFAMAVIQFAQANDGVGNAGQDKWQSFCAEQNLTDPLYSFDNAAKFSKAYQDAAKGSSMFTGREENLRTDKKKSDLGARLKRIPESFNDEIKAKLNSQSRSV
jgi:hypothetical protein